MPDKKSDGDTPEAKESSGGSKQMITTALLAVILVGVGYFLGGKLGGGEASAEDTPDAAAEVEKDETPHVGIVIDLDAININLADSRYLRVAVSLGLDEHYDAGGGGGHGGGDEVEFSVAAASDVLLRTFTGMTIAELSTEQGREAARQEMLEGLEPHYGHDVVAIYFTEFVMQ